MAPGGMITGSSEPYMPGGSQVFGAPPAVTAEEEEEPDVIK